MSTVDATGRTRTAASVAVGGVAAAIVLLAVLHVVQPGLSPATSVVSQYALGTGGWLMALVFIGLGVGALATAATLRGQVGKPGLILLAIAAVGLFLAAIFPVGVPMHDVAALLGNLGLPVGAALAGHALARRLEKPTRQRLLVVSHAPWILVVAMMATLFLAPGVVGWLNRLAVLSYGVWMIAASRAAR